MIDINYSFPFQIKFGVYTDKYHAVILDAEISETSFERIYMFDIEGNLLWVNNSKIFNFTENKYISTLNLIRTCVFSEDEIFTVFTYELVILFEASSGKIITISLSK
jgi:hypothetical protein